MNDGGQYLDDEYALICCRVSDRKQLKGSGLDSQEHRCRQHAQINGLKVEKVFYAAKSGGLSLMQRPEVQELVTYIDANAKSGKRYVVIFDDHKRFAREAEYHLMLRRMLNDRGVRVEFLNFTPEETPEGKFMELVFAGQAQLEREQNARQSRQKSIARLEKGYWVFRAPIGYRYEQSKSGGKDLVIDEILSPILKEGLEGFASGRFKSQTELRRFLESRPEYPKDTPSGEIRPQTIVRLLNKEVYAGLVACTKWGVALREGQHEGLISVASFERIQQSLKQGVYAPTRKDISDDFVLRGAVNCSCCDTPLTGGWSKGKFKKYAYYRCRNRDCAEYGASIPRATLEVTFSKLLSTMVPDPTLFKVAAEMFKDRWDDVQAQATASSIQVGRNIRALDKQIDDFVNRTIETQNPRMVAAYEKKIEALEKEKLIMREKASNMEKPQYSYRELFELSMRFLSNPWKLWHSGHLHIQRLVLKLAFSKPLTYSRKEDSLNTNFSLPFKALTSFCGGSCEMVPLGRIELPASPLPRVRSTTELQRPIAKATGVASLAWSAYCHRQEPHARQKRQILS